MSWALRQIGKRNRALNGAAVGAATAMRKTNSPSARWVAADALRELTGDKVREMLGRKEQGGAPRARR